MWEPYLARVEPAAGQGDEALGEAVDRGGRLVVAGPKPAHHAITSAFDTVSGFSIPSGPSPSAPPRRLFFHHVTSIAHVPVSVANAVSIAVIVCFPFVFSFKPVNVCTPLSAAVKV